MLGLQEVGGADAQSQLDSFCDVLEEVCKRIGDNGGSKFDKVFASLESLMSEPSKRLRMGNLSEEQQNKFSMLMNFVVASINLVGMGDQAEASLKVWEGILFKDNNNIVGSEKQLVFK